MKVPVSFQVKNIGTWKSATMEENFNIPRRKYNGVSNKHGEYTMF
jgi:hypothetical protein